MGRIIQQNNGKTTVYVTGENINNLPVSADTYYIGVDVDGNYKLLNPSGDTSDFTSGGFTGGTISGDTVFIGELSATVFSAETYLNLPVSTFTGGTVSGDTVFIGDLSATVFSAETYLNLPCCADVPVTYNEFLDKITGGTLTVGTYYLITDFKTCYDQPDYDTNGNPIIIGNYKEGPVEPILVLATSPGEISKTAYQPLYPNDRIQYDWTWDMTEVTDGVAYGRITERIDEFNNRTDYDHRNIYFKRYTTYFYNMDSPLNGTIEIYNDGSVTGTSTNFTSLGIGNVIKVKDGLNYQIVSISGDTEMYVTGLTINTGAGLTHYLTYAEMDNDGSDSLKSYDFKHNNVMDTETRELPTFRFQWELDNYGEATSINNYIGNHSNFLDTNLSHSYFLLANNTFSLYSYSNTLGDRCYNNSSYTWFCRNKISGNFYNNSMWRGFYANIVGEYCDNNIFGGYTWRNKLGEGFESNKTFDGFENNIVNNGFNDNDIASDFYENNIGNDFNYNIVFGPYYSNEISNGFNNNNIYTPFYDNTIDNYFNDNNIGDINNPYANDFYRNNIGVRFQDNLILKTFNRNQIGVDFQDNVLSGETRNNVIGNSFEFNTTYPMCSFNDNKISNEFKGNLMRYDFSINEISSYVGGNQFSGSTSTNKIGSYTFDNDFYGNIYGNIWSNNFYQNLIGNDFSYNNVSDSLNNNDIASGFQNNQINQTFTYNDIAEYFTNNIMDTVITYVDFTSFVGNISGLTYSATGDTASDDVYTVSGTTNGAGVNATFTVTVSSGLVTDVSAATAGKYYSNGDTVTILGSQIDGTNGVDDVIITITSVSILPNVYEEYTCQIFENSNGTKRLSYYDESDVLTITDVNK